MPMPTLSARTNRRRETAFLAPAQQSEAAATATSEETAPTDLAGTTTARRPTSRPVLAAPEARASSRPQPESRRSKDEKPEAPVALYTIRTGDNLTKLAREQGVSIAQLKTWNKLTTENVVIGQQLRLAAPADATALPVAATSAMPAPRARPAALAPPLETHTVQPGDTLFSIARHFGLSLEELKRLNHLASDRVKLKPGQKLVVHG
ncbi:MAG: LysM peptidoglycan-binding domain-containing protein [Cytophagaceae bacterium]|nr:MAG: LysM peptidoglycan-binding domain-containing protein [Cytophagaceae bacterium]